MGPCLALLLPVHRGPNIDFHKGKSSFLQQDFFDDWFPVLASARTTAKRRRKKHEKKKGRKRQNKRKKKKEKNTLRKTTLET